MNVRRSFVARLKGSRSDLTALTEDAIDYVILANFSGRKNLEGSEQPWMIATILSNHRGIMQWKRIHRARTHFHSCIHLITEPRH